MAKNLCKQGKYLRKMKKNIFDFSNRIFHMTCHKIHNQGKTHLEIAQKPISITVIAENLACVLVKIIFYLGVLLILQKIYEQRLGHDNFDVILITRVFRTLFIQHVKLDFSMMILAWCRYPKKEHSFYFYLFWYNDTMLKSSY